MYVFAKQHLEQVSAACGVIGFFDVAVSPEAQLQGTETLSEFGLNIQLVLAEREEQSILREAARLHFDFFRMKHLLLFFQTMFSI